MDEDRSSEILDRLEAIEQRLHDLDVRLNGLEQLQPRVMRPVEPGPPPFVRKSRTAEFSTEYFPEAIQTPSTAPTAPASASRPIQLSEKEDTEYLIGAKIMPKVGAAFMLLGLSYLVVLAYSKGLITPAMMFGIEVAFCAAFVLVGVLKRDMKEEYGQILTGIGSCGLYLVFAGGHLYYHLYQGETLVGLFFALSLANLAFSLWRSSRSFLTIGLLGGLVTASVLPNMKGDHSIVNAWIHFLILIPTALIIAKNKWMDMTVILWLSATTALVPILNGVLPWGDKVAILYVSTAICIAAYCWSYRVSEFDTYNTLLPVILWIVGLIGLGLNHDPAGAWQFAGFALLFGGLAVAFWKRPELRNPLLVGAIGVPGTLAPFCFSDFQAVQIFSVISVAAGLVSFKLLRKPASVSAFIGFVLALLVYLQWDQLTRPWQSECLLLSALIASVIVSGFALAKAWGNVQVFSLSGMAFCLLFVGRLVTQIPSLASIGHTPGFAIATVLIGFTYYSLVLYYFTKWESAYVAFCVLYTMALTGYGFACYLLGTSLDLGLLLPLAAIPLVAGTMAPQESRVGAQSIFSIVLGGLFTRLFYMIAHGAWRMPDEQATIVGALIYALASFVFLRLTGKKFVLAGGWVMLSFAALIYMAAAPFALAKDLWISSGLLITLVLAGRWTAPYARNKDVYEVFLGIAGWAAFSRWSWIAISLYFSSTIGPSPALSMGWIIYGLALLMLGFAYRRIRLRYVAFVVMAATIAKVLIVDLATTDQLLRVGITLGLAITLLAASYWYVRLRERSEKSASSLPEA